MSTAEKLVRQSVRLPLIESGAAGRVHEKKRFFGPAGWLALPRDPEAKVMRAGCVEDPVANVPPALRAHLFERLHKRRILT